jgi:phage shock protein PspC (stress-responsive transcriptional regulator)
MKRRMVISIFTGAILGIICVIGLSIRIGFVENELFILATWVNRIIMGLVIGLAPYYKINNNTKNIILRGAFFGFMIGGSFFIATDFKDTPGFIAGIMYGIIIDFIATKYEKK